MKYAPCWFDKLTIENVTHYGYRQQRVVGDDVITLPRELMDPVQKLLADIVGKRPDNHQTFVIRYGRSYEVALWFHDGICNVGELKDMYPMDY